jgi:signal transduction histidine kinase
MGRTSDVGRRFEVGRLGGDSVGVVGGCGLMRASWARPLLVLSTVGYLILLVALEPADRPTVALLAFVPLVIAGGFFGLGVGVGFTIGLAGVTMLVIELGGPGMDVVLATYRGIPLLMFVMTGIVVGRLRDLHLGIEKELERRRLVELALRDTQRQLEELVEAKDELIASVGHELRTPLTAVLGFAEMLRIGNEAEMSQGDRIEMVDFIAREAFDLSGIIDDLLVAARIEIGKLEVTKVPTVLGAQLAQVLESWDPEKIARISVAGEDSRAIADPARVRQILRNIITNALRYGGNDIEVEIGADTSAVFVEVRDDGPGLPAEEWERVFDPYYRYHSEPGQPGSVGLGLTVARSLADLMGGSLTYRHDNGESIFTLRLPRAAR